MKPQEQLTCPSAQPDMEGARIIGVLSGTPEAPRVAYAPPGVTIALESIDLGDLPAPQVFRFAATCEQHRCAHFDGARCSLAQRIVAQLPEVVDILPRCQIRLTCRWYAEEGAAACRRCPQVVTMIPRRNDDLNRVAAPPTLVEDLRP
jgi:hypothetical protein